MPSTMTIIPVIKMMVLQLMPLCISPPWPTVYQKVGSIMVCRARDAFTASKLCMARMKTTRMVAPPATRATR